MSEIDDARDLLRDALNELPPSLRPQEAATVVADLAYLLPVVPSIALQVSSRLENADRLPGLYSTAGDGAFQ